MRVKLSGRVGRRVLEGKLARRKVNLFPFIVAVVLMTTAGTVFCWASEVPAGTTDGAELTPLQVPSAPNITSPGSSSRPGPTLNTLTPTLQWNAVSNATSYALAISKYPYGSGNIIYNPQYVYGTSHTVPAGRLQPGVLYRWNMQARNSSGVSAVSNTLYFVTPTPPGAPVLIKPADGARNVPTRPTFEWRPVSGATGYYLMVAHADDSFHLTTTGTSLTLPAARELPEGQLIGWAVAGVNAAGLGERSEMRTFTTKVDVGPLIRLSGDLAFGEVTVGESAQRTLTIHNDGDAALNVSSISYPTGFSGSWSGSISAGSSRNVTVTFRPVEARSYSGTITVHANAASGTNTRSCSGIGVGEPAESVIRLSGNLSFGEVTVGESAQRTLTIHNDGDAALNVSSISYPTGFSGSWSGSISAGNSRNVTVTFRPTEVRSYSGTVTVRSNAASGTNTRSCSGSGVEPVASLKITTTSPLPGGSVGVSYSQDLTATGGTTPYSWSWVSGSLPPGLSPCSGGTISGTPTTVGSYSFTVQVQDSQGLTAQRTLSISVTDSVTRFDSLTPSTITTSTAPYDAELSAIGSNFNNVNRVTFTWSGPASGSATWNRGDSNWNTKVTVHSNTSMTLEPRVVETSPTWTGKVTWTLTMRDTAGSTASRSFTVVYTREDDTTLSECSVTISSSTGFVGRYNVCATCFTSSGWAAPIPPTEEGKLITHTNYDFDSPIYRRNHGFRHGGVDWVGPHNSPYDTSTPVYAIGDGVIRHLVRDDHPTSNNSRLHIEHTAANGNTFLAIYGHAYAGNNLSVGDPVSQGQRIGTLRPAGFPVHLHFELNTILTTTSYGGVKAGTVNPLQFLVENPGGVGDDVPRSPDPTPPPDDRPEHTYGQSRGWYMVSVPTTGDTAAIFGASAFWWWNPATGAYERPSTLNPGYGYWAQLPVRKTVTASGTVPTRNHGISLDHRGWHQISAPWSYPKSAIQVSRGGQTLSWADAVRAGWVRDTVFGYKATDGAYTTPATLNPWYGYWLYARVEGVSLRFDYGARASSTCMDCRIDSGPMTVEPADLPGKPWMAELAADNLSVSATPNPLREGTATFQVAGPLAADTSEIKVQVLDVSGRSVFTGSAIGSQLTWDVEGIANGVYLYRVEAKVAGQWVTSSYQKLLIVR